jgi:tRNA dimethylallyltransferase
VLEGQITVEEAKQLIGRATRVFIRRQANWFKESDPTIQWFEIHDGIVEGIEIYLRNKLSS